MRMLPLLVAALGCTESQSGPPSDRVVGETRYAILQSGAQTKLIFVSTRSTPLYPLTTANSNLGWRAIELQDDNLIQRFSAGEDATIDLAVDTPLVIHMNYPAACGGCSSSDEPYTACWLTVHYKAGDPGLHGTVRIRNAPDGLVVGYDFYWEGNTDRFGCGSRPHKQFVTATDAVQPRNIAEVPL